MAASKGLAGAIRAALEQDGTVNLRAHPKVDVGIEDGTVVLRGEVADIAAKRRIAHRVAAMAALAGAGGLSDRLRVIRAEQRGDGAISDMLHARLASEPVFLGYRVQLRDEAGGDHEAGDGHAVLISVDDGTVTLAGVVGSLSHRRFADVLAWWTPGVADVDNRLLVRPPEDDNDDEITDALRLVFEKDPSLDAGQLRAGTRHGVVRLDGLVHSSEQKRHAELDAWCILGVHEVDNRIEVRP